MLKAHTCGSGPVALSAGGKPVGTFVVTISAMVGGCSWNKTVIPMVTIFPRYNCRLVSRNAFTCSENMTLLLFRAAWDELVNCRRRALLRKSTPIARCFPGLQLTVRLRCGHEPDDSSEEFAAAGGIKSSRSTSKILDSPPPDGS